MDTALFNIFDLPMVIAIFVGLILASVLLISRPRAPRHLLLSAYLYVLSLVELEKMILWNKPLHGLFESAIPELFALGKCIGLLVPPLLYLYIRAFDSKQKAVSQADVWMIVIPISGVVLAMLLYQSLGNDPAQYMPSNYHAIFFNPLFSLILITKYTLLFTFAGVCLKRKQQIDAELNIVFVGALCIYGFEFATDLLAALSTNGALLDSMGIFHNYMVLAYVCIMLVYMLKQHFLNSPVTSKKNNPASRKIVNQDARKIHQLMVEHKYYLDADISLESLAKKFNMPEYQLSALMNKKFEKNFFDFINSYRMEHAKKLMTTDSGEGCSILDILYDSGFNSKSAFNRCFKKYTGITPSEYREKFRVVS